MGIEWVAQLNRAPERKRGGKSVYIGPESNRLLVAYCLDGHSHQTSVVKT